MSNPKEVLKNVFGYDDFRPLQGEVIEHVCEGGSAVVLFPTGKGKSLCYQIPAICRDGVGIVVSPLISLMRDQLVRLEELGVASATINSTISAAERREIVDALKMGQIDLLYVTPEQVATARFQTLLREIDVALVAVDEAHCISQMGNDFRPDYNALGLIRGILPDVPMIAATATADEETLSDMLVRLDMKDATIFKSSFDRANIHYSMEMKSKKPREQMLAKIDSHKGQAGIVYCIGRNTVDKTAAWLRSEGYDAYAYHAGMTNAQREESQDAFLSGKAEIMVATVAFGMGIDKPDVRYVLHTDMPTGLESFYQESGRAGRDGLPANSYVFYGNANVVQRQRMIKKGKGGAAVKRTGQAKLDALMGVLETAGCRRKGVLHYFGEQYSGNCGNCDNCQSSPATRDATAEAQAIVDLFETGLSLTAFEIVGIACGKSPASIDRALQDSFAAFRHDWSMWSAILRQMVASGMIDVVYSRQAEMLLSSTGMPGGGLLLRGGAYLTSAKARSTGTRRGATSSKPRASSPSSSPRRRSNPYEIEEYASTGFDLVEALRKKRQQLARAEKKKEYFVLHNETLEEIARVKPRTGRELLAIKGVGERKVEQYGSVILGIVSQYAAAA
ncbi:ATP-dependent DNA helicase RecQ [Rhizobium leguminosarum]|uniref:RecQ family ATP-dependent DNA helicase n=1 Tax=Rhizobium leguminosarum TaxID=384 RepID=UPI002E12CDD2|nr:ATP-dependent DNA helicase RecQ [Rhizobium leguminosarum]